MIDPDIKDLAAIGMSGLTGTGVWFSFSELSGSYFWLPAVATLCAVFLLPFVGGWISPKAGNVLFFPICVLIGITAALQYDPVALLSDPVAYPSDTVVFRPASYIYVLFFTAASALWQGGLASVSFFIGWGAERLVGRSRERSAGSNG